MIDKSLNHLKILMAISIALNTILLAVVIFVAINLTFFIPKPEVVEAPISQTQPVEDPISQTTTLDIIAVKTTTIIPEVPKFTVSRSITLDPHEQINNYVDTISSAYDVDPYLIMSVIQQESEYLPKAQNGNCVGLMQVSQYWHSKRAQKLGVTNFYDPHDNILLGVDYIAELLNTYKDPSLVLMLYNMDHQMAFKLYSQGRTTDYAKKIIARAETYRKGV
jgi:hypothetical protein